MRDKTEILENVQNSLTILVMFSGSRFLGVLTRYAILEVGEEVGTKAPQFW